jgi:hypothetical protein
VAFYLASLCEGLNVRRFWKVIKALRRNTTLTSLGLAANGLGEDERGFYWRGIAYVFEPNTDPCGVEKNGPGV